MQGSTNNDTEFRLTYDATIDSATFGAPDGVDADETACEVALPAITTTADGIPSQYLIIPAETGRSLSVETRADVRDRITLGDEVVVILWARRKTADATTVSAVLSWEEQW